MLMVMLVILPLLSAIPLGIWGNRSRGLRGFLSLAIPTLNFLLMLLLSRMVYGEGTYTFTVVNTPPFSIIFSADLLGIYMGLLITFLWPLTILYSFGYMAHEHAQTRYYTSLMLALASTMGIIFSQNLVTFFIFFEGLTISVYPLVIHDESEEAYQAGVKYAVYLLTGGVLILMAIVALYGFTGGDVSFHPNGIPGLDKIGINQLYILFFLFTAGFGFKAAIMPLHSWLPDAMIAPTPVSAVLHAVAVVNVGLYGFLRVIYNVFGLELYQELGLGKIIGILGAVTIILAAIIALRQKEIKRMLAYSTVNQLSYVLLGIVSFRQIGMMGGILHIVYHSFMKITLFYCAGAIITQSRNKYIDRMAGLARQMPVTMAAFVIGAVGIIGLPPVAGWVSKWYMIQGYLQGGQPVFALVFILSGLIELGYFAPPIFLAYFRPVEVKSLGAASGITDPPLTMLLPIIIAALGSLIFGLWGLAPHWLAQPILKQFVVNL